MKKLLIAELLAVALSGITVFIGSILGWANESPGYIIAIVAAYTFAISHLLGIHSERKEVTDAVGLIVVAAITAFIPAIADTARANIPLFVATLAGAANTALGIVFFVAIVNIACYVADSINVRRRWALLTLLAEGVAIWKILHLGR